MAIGLLDIEFSMEMLRKCYSGLEQELCLCVGDAQTLSEMRRYVMLQMD
jgi:hypothetical protein